MEASSSTQAELRLKRLREESKMKQNEIKGQRFSEEHEIQVKTNVIRQKKPERVNMSQSLLNYVNKVKSAEEACYHAEQNVQEATEVCNRQQQNLCDLTCEIEQLKLKCDTEMKNKNALELKIQHGNDCTQELYLQLTKLTESLQRLVVTKDTAQSYIEGMKSQFDVMLRRYSKLTDKMPTIDSLEKKLSEQQAKNNNLAHEFKIKNDFILEQNKMEKKSADNNVCNEETYFNGLTAQIMCEKGTSEKLTKDIEVEAMEKNKEAEWLRENSESFQNSNASVQNDLLKAQKEIAAATSMLNVNQSELSETKARVTNHKATLLALKSAEDICTKSLLDKELELENFTHELEDERVQSRNLTNEIEELRLQIQKTEDDLDSHIKSLAEDRLKLSSIFNEEEEVLRASFNNLKTKLAHVSDEEDILDKNLLDMEGNLQDLNLCLHEALQEKSTLEQDLECSEKELQQLKKKLKSHQDSLSAEKALVEEKQATLLQMKASYDSSIESSQCQLTSLKDTERLAMSDLESVELTAKDLQSRIEAVQRDSSSVCAHLTEMCEQQTRNLKETIINLERELELLASEFKDKMFALHQNLQEMKELQMQKDSIISDLNSDNIKKREEISSLHLTLVKLTNQKEQRKTIITKLNEDVSQLIHTLTVKKELEQENNLARENIRVNCRELENQISEETEKYQNLQMEISSILSEHEIEKRAHLKGLKDFQITRDRRIEQSTVLKKQICLWKEKIDKQKERVEDKKKALSTYEQRANEAKEKGKELERQVKEWQENVLVAMKEASQAEKESMITQKKTERLQDKIAAHRAEKMKKRQGEKSAPFKEPTPTAAQAFTTPQASMPAPTDQDSQEITPRSILKKTPTKLPTPQSSKRVTFVDDDGSSSSASSIMLGPEIIDEIVKNPSMRDVICAQFKDRQSAAKRRKLNEDEAVTVHPMNPTVPDNEITSSTPDSKTDFDWS